MLPLSTWFDIYKPPALQVVFEAAAAVGSSSPGSLGAEDERAGKQAVLFPHLVGA